MAITKVHKLFVPAWYLPNGTINATEDELEGASPLARPEDEIEVTDAMVDAGLAALNDSDARYERTSSVVISIYRAMDRARLLPCGPSPDSDSK
jgi:hypothetical protein